MAEAERASNIFHLSVSEYRRHIKILNQKKAKYVHIYTDYTHAMQVFTMLASTSGIIFLLEGVSVKASLLKEISVLSWEAFLKEANKNDGMHLKLYYGDSYSLSICFVFDFYLGTDNSYQPSLEFEYLFKTVPVDFSAYRIETCGNGIMIVFSHIASLERNKWRNKLRKHIILFLPVIGYGDLVIMLPLFREYFLSHKDYSVTIYSADQKVNTMVKHFFPSLSIEAVSLDFLDYRNKPVPLHYKQLSLLVQCVEQISHSGIYKEVILLKLDDSQMHMQSAYETFARSMHVYPNNALKLFQYPIADMPILDEVL